MCKEQLLVIIVDRDEWFVVLLGLVVNVDQNPASPGPRNPTCLNASIDCLALLTSVHLDATRQQNRYGQGM